MTNQTTREAVVPVTLKPCPFCGGDNIRVHGPYGWYRQWCISHSCRSFYSGSGEFSKGFRSKDDAVSAWNARRRAQPAGDVREALAHLVRSVDDLIAESAGVYGLHLNGDPAPIRALKGGEEKP